MQVLFVGIAFGTMQPEPGPGFHVNVNDETEEIAIVHNVNDEKNAEYK